MRQAPRVRQGCQALGARCEHVGRDAPLSEIQFLMGNDNIHGSGVEMGSGELKKGKNKNRKQNKKLASL